MNLILKLVSTLLLINIKVSLKSPSQCFLHWFTFINDQPVHYDQFKQRVLYVRKVCQWKKFRLFLFIFYQSENPATNQPYERRWPIDCSDVRRTVSGQCGSCDWPVAGTWCARRPPGGAVLALSRWDQTTEQRAVIRPLARSVHSAQVYRWNTKWWFTSYC